MLYDKVGGFILAQIGLPFTVPEMQKAKIRLRNSFLTIRLLEVHIIILTWLNGRCILSTRLSNDKYLTLEEYEYCGIAKEAGLSKSILDYLRIRCHGSRDADMLGTYLLATTVGEVVPQPLSSSSSSSRRHKAFTSAMIEVRKDAI